MSQAPIKRVKYFTSQFLEATDFQLEQNYHIDMRRLGNRVLFSAGIVDDGFQVSIKPGDATRIVIGAGAGFDADGREIVAVVEFEVTVPVPVGGNQNYRVALAYREQETEQQTVDTDFSDNTRYLEQPQVNFFVDAAAIDNKTWIVVGAITVNAAGSATGNTPATPLRAKTNARILGRLGIGTLTPQAALQVTGGAIMPASGAGRDAGIRFADDPGGGAGDSAWIRHYARAGEDTTLEIGTANDAQDHIALMPSGNVGIGTLNPQAKLDVAGAIRAGNSDLYFTKTDHDHTGTGNAAGFAAIENAANYDALMILGRANSAVPQEPTAPRRRVVKLWDFLEVNGTLKMEGGALMPTAGSSESAGLLFAKDPGGGAGDRAWLRYYARAGEDTTLELGTSNDAADHIALMPSGNVGIGRNDPQAKLHVNGDSRLDGNLFFGGANPLASVGFTNVLTPKNLVKAWGVVQTGPNATFLDGFNVESVSCGGGGFAQIVLKNALANVSCIVATNHGGEAAILTVRYLPGGRTLEVHGQRISLGVPGSVSGRNLAEIDNMPWQSQVYFFSFIVMGAQ
jgi:hypothetical protein